MEKKKINQVEDGKLEAEIKIDKEKFEEFESMINTLYENFCVGLMHLKDYIESHNIISTTSIKLGQGELDKKKYDIILAINPVK